MDDVINIKNSEDFQKYKKEILERLEEAIDNNRPFFIIAKGPEDDVATAGGTNKGLTEMIGIALHKAEPLREIVEIAIKFAEYLDEKHKKAYAEVTSHDISTEIVRQLNCETCDAKEECEIYQIANKGDHTVAEFIKALKTKHPELASLIQVRGMMAKGGDA